MNNGMSSNPGRVC